MTLHHRPADMSIHLVPPTVDDELETMIREIEEEMEGVRYGLKGLPTKESTDRLSRHHTLARRRVALLTAQAALQTVSRD